MKDGYCENCPNPIDCYSTGRCWPVVDYVPDAGKLCAEMDDTANERLARTTCSPSLDCSRDELVAYIRSMKGGERVMEMGGSGMTGMKGTVEIRNGNVCIRWDRAEYADGAGVMVTSFTGGARIIQENSEISGQ